MTTKPMPTVKRAFLIEVLLLFLALLISAPLAIAAAIVFGEQIILWWIASLVALVFGMLCYVAVLIAKALFDTRGKQ